MDTSKFICEKCSQPIGSGETIIIQDKCYHKTCCECCICKKVPSVINIFQSKIYCPGCLSKHIGSLNMSHECNNMKDDTKCVCNKCLEQISDPLDKIVIGDKCFHKKCCECCICKEVPSVINIFQCQIYCAECLSKHILGSRNMNQENTKDDMKCVCNKCLEPISDPLDKIVIGAQCFHKKCCECCVCKKIPKFLRAYQCQIYCPECFTKCVLEKELKDFTNDDTTCVCQKCFEHISDPLDRIVIGNKCYHKKCCECSICRKNPTVIKAHQCQIYCQDCYNKHVFGEPTMGTGDSAKCMCERCLEPILDPLDKVVVGNKCYHKKCCECCVCKRLASVPRPYQCQMYCQECFNKLVLGHGWNRSPEQSQCLCDKCLAQILDPSDKIVIGNKCYHKKCCQCCVCKKVPTIIKVYQCQVFCPECFVKYIIGQGCRRNFRFWNNISMPTSYQYAMSRKLNEMMRSGCSKGPVILMTNDTECDVKFDGMHLPGCSKFCFPHGMCNSDVSRPEGAVKMYGRKTPSTYRSTPSVYSHYTGKSSTNLRSSKSLRSIRVPWYQKPILHDAYFLDLQRGALLTAVLSVLVGLFTIAQGLFDLYCLGMATPGTTHYGYYIFSFQFVYVGSVHVRNALIVFALFSLVGAMAVVVTGVMLIVALRKEHEKRIVPWLFCFGVFIAFRLFVFVFAAIVNDMIFAYNVLMCLCWVVFCVFGVYGWVLVYSLYLELTDLTKLEDLAHLRMGTMASLNASLAGSRPTTPHSTVSTMPASQI